MSGWLVVVISGCYLGVLFAVAYWGDRRKDAGRSVISSGTIYALSLAVYATSWTFYGSVGRAAAPASASCRSTSVRRSWRRSGGSCCERSSGSASGNRITSLADFVGTRYGKSAAARRRWSR